MTEKKGQRGKQIHWYPGHMASASRELKSAWRHIDAVVEIADARIPAASRNPLFSDFQPQKPHLLLLSHADLADLEVNKAWLSYYLDQDLTAIFCDLRNAADIRFIRRRLLLFHAPLLEKAKSQGRLVRPLRVLVTGIPNTGKSTFINQFVGKRSAKVESRPGVTRQQSWLRSGSELHFLDTPGILPPKLDDREASMGLAATGAIRDSILPLEEVARWLFKRLTKLYPQALTARYGSQEGLSQDQAFEAAALTMGCQLAGGLPDLIRFSTMLLDDFRGRRIDRISLERPAGDEETHD